MNIPKSFHIKGKLWTVEYKWGLRDEGDLVDGLCVFTDRTIYLRRELLKEEKPMAFLHELIHAVLYECHLHQAGGLSDESEEIICDGVADVLTTLFTMRFKRVS
jgi:hypothetical protein